MKLPKLPPRSSPFWNGLCFWCAVIGAFFGLLGYTMGYQRTAGSFAFGVIWPLLCIMWAILWRQTLIRHKEW